MKKIIIFIILIIPINVFASTCVIDTDTNRILYENNGNKVDLIASTTKILTSLLVIKNEKNLDKEIIIDESVLKSYGSSIYIEVGEKISIRNLLYGLMLRSGNDAALVLANYIGGSMEGFAILMNEYASSIGMKNSTFINSSGLENEDGIGNTSTSCDMALLMSYAIKNKELQKIMSTKEIIVKTNYKTYKWINKNKLLSMYEYTTGGKTGYTKKAYRTLVTSASKNNINISVATLREKDDFKKHKNLYNKIFNEYKKTKILNRKELNTCIKEDYYLTIKDEDKVNYKYNKNKIDIYVNNMLVDSITKNKC